MTGTAAMDRRERQALSARWCIQAFGEASATDPRTRALRLLEEALELFQAEGGDREQAIRLADRVFGRPPGEASREAGGIGVTLLNYCAAAGIDADACEAAELDRVLARPLADARARHDAKRDAGF